VQLGGKLDAAYQLDAPGTGLGQRLVVTGEGIVIGNAEDVNARPGRLLDQARGRAGAVGFVGVRVQIDQSKPNPNVPV
jgi:hypothetical protein